jgi:hypothetical protein
MKTPKSGQTATLIEPYRGYRAIELVEKNGYKWTVRIIDSGVELEVYDDEFIVDDNNS